MKNNKLKFNSNYLLEQKTIRKKHLLGKKRITSFFVILTILVSGILIPVVSADQVDQENEPTAPYEGEYLILRGSLAQSFKPTLSTLTKIELYLHKVGSPQGIIKFNIRHNLDGGNLTTKQLYTQLIPTSDHGTWVTVDFFDITVNPEEEYFIVLYDFSMSSDSNNYLKWVGNSEEYDRGSAWEKPEPWDDWSELEDFDFCFKTYGEEIDDDPPQPNPSEWELIPHADGPYSISMTATIASDPSGDVMYYFKEISGNSGGSDSGWKSSQSYTDNGLQPDTQYTYQVRTRDALGNIGYWSTSKSATTPPYIAPPSVSTDGVDFFNPFPKVYGTLNSLGGTDNCEVWLVYDTNSHANWAEYKWDTIHKTKTSTGQFDCILDAYGMDVTYYYRAIAKNSGGTVQGDEKHFDSPSLSFDPEILNFGQVLKDKTYTETFKILNTGGAVLYYSLSSTTDWITDITPTSGSISGGDFDEITVIINTAGLPVGERTGHLQLSNIFFISPYDYPVKIKVVNNFAPPDAIITTSDIDYSLLTKNPFINDLFLNKWPTIPDNIASAGWGYYGHEANIETGHLRAAIKEDYSAVLLVPEWLNSEAHLRATYTVPVNTLYGTPHIADISLSGNCQGEVWIEDLGGSNAIISLIILEGTSQQYPYSMRSIGFKDLKKYEVGAFISQEDKSFNHEFTDTNNKITVCLKEGHTYSFWISAISGLLLEGLEIEIPYLGKFGYYGKGWTDMQFQFNSIKIHYHNPPVSPPEGEHFPEITNVNGPNNLIIGHTGSYTVFANDNDGDQLYYKWDWGDGTVTDWLGPYDSEQTITKEYTYDFPGNYYIRVQAKEKTDYELQSEVSDPLEVIVYRPDGSISIQKPKTGDSWQAGTTQTITWIVNGEVGDLVFITLCKKDNPEYFLNVTTEPIFTDDLSYSWKIPTDITPDEDYQIILWTNPSCDISNEFTITPNQGPNTPKSPSGPSSGKTGKEYSFTSTTTDPQNNDIYYLFDWSDGTQSEWLGPYPSGDNVNAKHTWEKEGDYIVKVKAKDISDTESEWSEPFVIHITKNKKTSKNINIFKVNFLRLYPLLERLFNYIQNLSTLIQTI